MWPQGGREVLKKLYPLEGSAALAHSGAGAAGHDWLLPEDGEPKSVLLA
jgi:hypothetical protein